MYKRILFATDGSPTSEHALAQVAKLAGSDAEVRVITVLENPLIPFPAAYAYAYNADEFLDKLAAEGEATLDRSQETLVDLGVHVETKLIKPEEAGNDIPRAILEDAEDWAADVIVLGTHGRRGLKRMLMGSVAEQMIQISQIPVMLVHAPKEG
jgi:nucleotide-binding universal stress UspA family protein